MEKTQSKKSLKNNKQIQEITETKIETEKSDSNLGKKIETVAQDSELERTQHEKKENDKLFRLKFELDLISVTLFVCGLVTRMWRLDEPKNIVFDELHYGKYISLYMKNTFFFDIHPPLGKQLIAAVAYFAGYDGKFKFDRIGSAYTDDVPLFALRCVPAFFGSLVIPTAYHLMLELGMAQWTALLAGLLLLLDNALLTQSRFILMDSLLLFFALFGILCYLKFRSRPAYSPLWWFHLVIGTISLTLAVCIKYVGFYSLILGLLLLARDFWELLRPESNPQSNIQTNPQSNPQLNSQSNSQLNPQSNIGGLSDRAVILRALSQGLVVIGVPILVYVSVFYVHLGVLYKAGPHDSIMTSAFQASLEGGLASITRGQPVLVAHGSQITLRHTHGRTCWLHSHQHVYPVRYSDKRGSSHQQQVTCYSFKDVNNWWIVKRPEKNDLVVEEPVDVIKHGDIVQLVHGITSRALNSHDVAAPQSPQCQEVSCYIDYNVSMPAQNKWRVIVTNRDSVGEDVTSEGGDVSDQWHAIRSLVRLVHVDTEQALKFTGRQLPDWGFNQHEVAADRVHGQDDTVWNVEEHRYTKSEDQKERERDLVSAEMIPTKATKLSFWDKFFELHYKMMFSGTDGVQNHMYSSEPLEWPLMSRGIAYYISKTSNAQIHLLGNLLIWHSATLSVLLYLTLLLFYLLRRRRHLFDIPPLLYSHYLRTGDVLLTGYLIHYLPFLFTERTLFLHHYLPAFTWKVLLLAGCIEHLLAVVGHVASQKRSGVGAAVRGVGDRLWQVLRLLSGLGVIVWLGGVVYVFQRFSVLSYGMTELTAGDIVGLRWQDTWDFIVHKN